MVDKRLEPRFTYSGKAVTGTVACPWGCGWSTKATIRDKERGVAEAIVRVKLKDQRARHIHKCNYME